MYDLRSGSKIKNKLVGHDQNSINYLDFVKM